MCNLYCWEGLNIDVRPSSQYFNQMAGFYETQHDGNIRVFFSEIVSTCYDLTPLIVTGCE